LEIEFSPYLSPLRYFKAYRYHPKFIENVSGGYRSLTYSHNIDPMKAVCPFEAAGGVCNDHSCEFQHFRDMSLSGALMDLKSIRTPSLSLVHFSLFNLMFSCRETFSLLLCAMLIALFER